MIVLALSCSGVHAQASQNPNTPTDTSGAATSQSPVASQTSNSLTEIIVTAQRREERVQDVPIAITALNPESLARQQVADARDLAGIAPGLMVVGQQGSNSTVAFSIRGLTDSALAIGSPETTAVYIDGVYLAVPDAAVFDLDDVERVEVLRGPQGTLYGRNATAGAINIITRQPTDVLKGGLDLSYGNFEDFHAKGWIAGPLGDGWSASLSGAASSRGDYLTNLYDGRRIGDQNSGTVRAKLRYENGDFDATLAGDYSRERYFPTFTTITNPATGQYIGFGGGDVIYTSIPDKDSITTQGYGGALTLDYKVSDAWSLTSITGWRKNHTTNLFDLWGVPVSEIPLLWVVIPNGRQTFSEELRAIYAGVRWRATVGANYYYESATHSEQFNPPSANATDYNPYDTSRLNAYAAFGQIEYDFNAALTGVLGLRYNYETRNYVVDYSRAPGPPNPTFSGHLSADKVLPMVGVNYKPARDMLLYAKVSEGYLAPGFNALPGANYTGSLSFDAQEVWAYELGAKTQWLDHRVTFDTAVFYYKYTNIAVRTSTLTQFVISNGATATGKGAEAELSVVPVEGVTLGAHASYVHATYDHFCDPIQDIEPRLGDPLCAPGVADRRGNFLNDAPEWMGGVSAAYTARITDATSLDANLSYSYQGNSYFSAANDPLISTHGGWDRVDARLALRLDKGLEVYVYGKNLTSKRYMTFVAPVSSTLAVATFDHEPRSYGGGVRWSF